MRPNNISRPIHIAPKKMAYHNANSVKRAPSTQSVMTPSCYTINHFYPEHAQKTPVPETPKSSPFINPHDVLPYMRIRQGNTPEDCHIVMDPKNIGLFMPWMNAGQSPVVTNDHATGRLTLTQSNFFPYNAFKAFDRSLLTIPSQLGHQSPSTPAWIIATGGDNTPSSNSPQLNGKRSTDFVKSLHCGLADGSDHCRKELTIQFASLTYHANGSPVTDEQGEPMVKQWLHVRIDIALAMLDFFFSQPLSTQYLEDVGAVGRHTWTWNQSWCRAGSTRGDLLGDYSYIESLELHQSSMLAGITSHQCVIHLTTIEATPAYADMVKRRDALWSEPSDQQTHSDSDVDQPTYTNSYFDDNDFSHVCEAMDTSLDLDLLEF